MFKSTMYKFLENWHFARVLQLVMGLISGGYGLYIHETAYLFVGAIFLFQAVFNISLCGAAGCSTPQQRSHRRIVDVEEYKPKK